MLQGICSCHHSRTHAHVRVTGNCAFSWIIPAQLWFTPPPPATFAFARTSSFGQQQQFQQKWRARTVLRASSQPASGDAHRSVLKLRQRDTTKEAIDSAASAVSKAFRDDPFVNYYIKDKQNAGDFTGEERRCRRYTRYIRGNNKRERMHSIS